MVEADHYYNSTTLIDNHQSFQQRDDLSTFVLAPRFHGDGWVGQPSPFDIIGPEPIESGRDFVARLGKSYSASDGSSYIVEDMKRVGHESHPYSRRRCRSRDSCSPDSCSSRLNSCRSDLNHQQHLQASPADDDGYFLPLAEKGLAVSSSSSSSNSTFLRKNIHTYLNCEDQNIMADPEKFQEKGFSAFGHHQSASKDFNTDATSLVSSDGSSQVNRGKKRGPRPKVITPLERRQKRLDANDRERQRMGQLNVAFDHLRTLLPKHGNDRELSKFETIQIAKNYIKALHEMLMGSSDKRPVTSSNRNRNQQTCS